MALNKRRDTGQFQPTPAWPQPQHRTVTICTRLHALPGPRLAAWLCAAWALVASSPAAAQAVPGPLTEPLRAAVQRLAQDAALQLWGTASAAPRAEVLVGDLPAHLRLAPCSQVQPYLPAGARPLGRTRIGLRCVQGPAHWNVSLPVTVRLWAESLVATTSLPAGTLLQPQHLARGQVDLAERSDPAIGQPALAVGRSLQRGLAAGDALRQADLKTRQLFNTGDTVRIVGQGPGYAVSSEGQALGPGLEGRSTRVRTDSGRVLTGIASAERRVDVAL